MFAVVMKAHRSAWQSAPSKNGRFVPPLLRSRHLVDLHLLLQQGRYSGTQDLLLRLRLDTLSPV